MIKKYPDFWHVLVGNGSIGALIGYILFAYVGAVVITLIDVSNRNVASKATPVKLSWSFFWADNISRIMADILLLPIAVRLCYEYTPPTAMLFLSIGLGLGVDALAMIAKRYGILTTSKLAEKVAQKLAPDDHDITPKTP